MKSNQREDETVAGVSTERRGEIALMVGAFLHSVHSGIVLICSLLFFAEVPVKAWTLFPAIVFATGMVVVIGKTFRQSIRDVLVACGVATVIAVGCFVAASQVYDLSYDGQWYHQEAALQLARGWVPGTPLADTDVPLDDTRWRIVHFPHASAVANATIYHLTGAIESAKGWNVSLMIASGCLAFAAMRRLAYTSRFLSIVVATGAALSPVATTQCMTFYVDGVTSSLILSLTSACAIWISRLRNDVSMITLSTLIGATLIATKPVAIVPVGIAFACLVAGRWYTARMRDRFSSIVTALVTFILGVGVAGYSPYVTNTVGFGHPFHPLVGPQSMNFDWRPSRPADFNEVGRYTRLFRSIFSHPQNSMTGERFDPSRLKWPFAMSLRTDAWTTFGYPDTRIAGFGPWYGFALLGAGVLLVMVAPHSPRAVMGATAIVVLIFGCALLNPEAWWARYSPQLWFAPFVLVAATACVSLPTWQRRFAAVIALILLANASLITGVALTRQIQLSRTVHDQLRAFPRDRQIIVDFGPFRSNRVRLREAGIRSVEGRVEGDAMMLPEMQMKYTASR